MSRWIERDREHKNLKVTIASMDECRHLYNEVCCNEDSPKLTDFVSPDDECKGCPFFQKEDGIITDS